MKELIIATRNEGKTKEFAAFFKDYEITVRSLNDLSESLPEIEETGTIFRENARLKAEGIAEILNKPVLADDSGLVIDYLSGRPGVYSARYAGESATDKANVQKVMRELKDIPLEKRTARFVAALALSSPGKQTVYADGYCEGSIGLIESGSDGFGYDPIFIPKGYLVSMASLSLLEKNRISHRTHALAALRQADSILKAT